MRVTVRGAWEFISTTVVAVAAITMLLFYFHDRTGGAPPSVAAQAVVDDWQDWEESANRMGAEGATMVVAAFMDFTCPFCRDLVSVFDSLIVEFPREVAIEYHHFPLYGHEFTIPSAIASECAQRQGRFAAMYHTLYSQMEAVGSKPWNGFAADAGIPDLNAFDQCIQLPKEAFGRIVAGRKLGESIGVTGTPKLWVNGEFFAGRDLAALRKRAKELGL